MNNLSETERVPTGSSSSIHNPRWEMKTKKDIEEPAIGSSPKFGEVNIKEATTSYEKWMRRCTKVISSELLSKHEQMKESPFLFLRGTFYRWANNGHQSAPNCATRPRFSPSEICM